ncbi:hypothetical protein BGX29_002956 [Mortierella sp. GBA35]|nr:hypothetical protein BGX29_002956 [Mortierella sp. GBA35]
MTLIVDLPEEVIALIGLRVDKRTIKVAILSCWYLHNSLAHLLWRQFALPSSKERFLLEAPKVEEHAHLVQSLVYGHGVPREYYAIRFPALYSLRLYFHSRLPSSRHSNTNEDQDRYQPTLISLNPHLKDLVLREIEPTSSTALWKTIYTSLHDPKRLEVHFSPLTEPDSLDSFWRACSRFEKVHLKIFVFFHCDTPPGLSFSRLKRVTLQIHSPYLSPSVGLERHLSWLVRCPNLDTLDWETYGDERFVTDSLIRALTDKTWPRLESFSWTGNSVTDDVSADIIRVLPPLKVYRISNRPFGDLSFGRLQEITLGP